MTMPDKEVNKINQPVADLGRCTISGGRNPNRKPRDRPPVIFIITSASKEKNAHDELSLAVGRGFKRQLWTSQKRAPAYRLNLRQSSRSRSRWNLRSRSKSRRATPPPTTGGQYAESGPQY